MARSEDALTPKKWSQGKQILMIELLLKKAVFGQPIGNLDVLRWLFWKSSLEVLLESAGTTEINQTTLFWIIS